MIRVRSMRGVLLLGLISANCFSTKASPQTLSWVTGYYFSPTNYGGLPVAEIDYPALTHIVHFAVLPKSDGTFEDTSLGYVTTYAADLIQTAHQNGVKVLLGIAQSSSGGDFRNATKPDTVDAFIANIMNLVNTYGYDGVDLDWESKIDTTQFGNLVTGLRAQLDGLPVRGLLTGAFWDFCCSLDTLADAFDQINLMTYDNCSPRDGFSSHNAALYDGGDPRRRTVEWRVNRFVNQIPMSKLGLGIPFYGYVWKGGSGTPTGGITAPGQGWAYPPRMTGIDYHALVQDPTLWQDSYMHRDEVAGNVPYLSIDLHSPDIDAFVTYDDEISVAAKVSYAATRGLGGVMVYELSADYFPDQDIKHPLLEAVRNVLVQ